ncbi:MAG TPA: cyclohexanone monooxygenase [Acidimicrobiaceae bacterium]|nr:cyclohexanone monooxygenase [Acidimicrobiaceae bacterium]
MADEEFDAVVIGAGIAGLYSIYRLREIGLSVKAYEKGDGVGGTWYWNRYPGARCDVQSWDYSYTFSEELDQEWDWTERYPTQPEIERYLNFVADRFDLRRDIEFGTRVDRARFDEEQNKWLLRTSTGGKIATRYLVSAVGALSESFTPKISGVGTFAGEQYHTNAWPAEGIDLANKRVGVIGTGSTGIQAIPQIAKQAEHLYVFQRTSQHVIPAQNHLLDDAQRDELRAAFRQRLDEKLSNAVGMSGFPIDPPALLGLDAETSRELLEDAWRIGGPVALNRAFSDTGTNLEANKMLADFVAEKNREAINDPEVAEKLLAVDHPIGSRRVIVGIDYFETYNRDNVTLLDAATSPIEEITPAGIRAGGNEIDLDVIVYATGFDGVSGPLLAMEIQGIAGLSLRDKWAARPTAFLGLVASGFPNLFMITGPGSPSVFSNVIIAIEQHVDWIKDCVAYMAEHGLNHIDSDLDAENDWTQHVDQVAKNLIVGSTKSWWTGQNIPGKPAGLAFYLGGLQNYRAKCDEVAKGGYKGFVLRSC